MDYVIYLYYQDLTLGIELFQLLALAILVLKLCLLNVIIMLNPSVITYLLNSIL